MLSDMKNISNTLLIIVAIFFSACTKDFEEYDRPKTTSDQIKPDFLFTRAQVTGSGLSVGIWQLIHQTSGSVYAQHFANIKPGFTSDNYEPSPGNSVWDWYYARNSFASLNLNYQTINLAREQGNPIKEAVARIWQVYMYQMITDMYGDIPYSEAFVNSKPSYDRQEDIYADLLNELAESMELIAQNRDRNFEGYGEADVFYQGDLTKWERFAGSLMMRLALRASNVAEGTLTIPYLSELDLSKTMQAVTDGAQIIPDADGPTYHVRNPMDYVYGWQEVRLSKTMTDFMEVYQDPRLQVFAEPNIHGEYPGLPNGQDQDDLNLLYNSFYQPEFCNIGSFFTQDETPHYLITYAEVCFMKAEAAAKGYIAGNAQAYYEEGIRASFEQFGITDPSVLDAYLNGAAAFSASNALELIYTQRWIALFPNGNEAWNLVRRTGYPQLQNPVYTWPDNPDMPRRVPYPVAERRYNADQYNAAVSNMGGDSQYTRVWWDGGN